jgi:hypothetical protein
MSQKLTAAAAKINMLVSTQKEQQRAREQQQLQGTAPQSTPQASEDDASSPSSMSQMPEHLRPPGLIIQKASPRAQAVPAGVAYEARASHERSEPRAKRATSEASQERSEPRAKVVPLLIPLLRPSEPRATPLLIPLLRPPERATSEASALTHPSFAPSLRSWSRALPNSSLLTRFSVRSQVLGNAGDTGHAPGRRLQLPHAAADEHRQCRERAQLAAEQAGECRWFWGRRANAPAIGSATCIAAQEMKPVCDLPPFVQCD